MAYTHKSNWELIMSTLKKWGMPTPQPLNLVYDYNERFGEEGIADLAMTIRWRKATGNLIENDPEILHDLHGVDDKWMSPRSSGYATDPNVIDEVEKVALI